MHNGAISQNPEALLAKIDELVAQNQAQSRELDGQRILLHWTQETLRATQVQRDALQAEIATLEEALARSRELLLAWDRTNEHQLAELTRLYALETVVPNLQPQIVALETEVRSLRDWNAATVSPCACKTSKPVS